MLYYGPVEYFELDSRCERHQHKVVSPFLQENLG